jgi:single-strand DNA-binding protein
MLIGRLTHDPELRYTANNRAVCSFSIATNRTWTNDDGSLEERVSYHRIVAWRKLAEICDRILSKGDKVYVEGRLQTNEWETKEGQKRRTTEVVARKMIQLSPKRGDSSGSSSAKRKKADKADGVSQEEVEESLNMNDSEEGESVDTAEVAEDIPF